MAKRFRWEIPRWEIVGPKRRAVVVVESSHEGRCEKKVNQYLQTSKERGVEENEEWGVAAIVTGEEVW